MSEIKDTLTKTERISMTLLIIIGLIIATRGVYWITNYSTAVNESPFYQTLDSVAPLYIWGAPFLIGGSFLIIASFNIINQRTRKVFDIYLTIGGLVSGLSFFIISMASISNALNWMTPVQNICFSVGCFSLMIIGIASLWTNRKHNKN